MNTTRAVVGVGAVIAATGTTCALAGELTPVRFELTSVEVGGTAPVVLEMLQLGSPPVTRISWDLEYSAVTPSWGSELRMDLVHVPSGFTRTFDGSDTNFADTGPNDVIFGWGDVAGAFISQNAILPPSFSVPDASGLWRLTIFDEFDDAGVDGTLNGLVTIEVTNPLDDCADAIEIFDAGWGIITIGATTDGPPLPAECDEGPGLNFVNDIWFSYTPATNGTLTVSTCELVDFDSRLAAYTGTCDALTLIACNDDAAGCELASRIEVPATIGESILLRIGAYAGQGTGQMVVELTPSCPPDLDGTESVGFNDLVLLLGSWGPCGFEPCPADLDNSGFVGFDDLVLLLGLWGPC